MLIGDARVSKADGSQPLALQRDALRGSSDGPRGRAFPQNPVNPGFFLRLNTHYLQVVLIKYVQAAGL